MDPRHIELVQRSLKRFGPSDDNVANALTGELLRIAPDADLPDGDLAHERQRCALAVIAVAVHSLHAPDSIIVKVRELAGEPGIETIRQVDYDYAGNAILRGLRKTLGAEFTSDLWDAWVEALCILSELRAKLIEPVSIEPTPRTA
jgi:nitric oxide dioxygenase